MQNFELKMFLGKLVWSSCGELTFGSRTNQSLDNVTLPNGLRYVTFGNDLDQNLSMVTVGRLDCRV